MAGVGTPKEKIEKDHNSQSNRTYEIPFAVHQTNTPFTLTPALSLKGEGFLKCLS